MVGSSKELLPPGPKGSGILGSTKAFASNTLKFITECREQYKDIAYTKIAFRDFYILIRPDYVHYVLQDNYKNYKKSFAYRGLKDMLGEGLLTSEGNFWLKQRRLTQPAFHRERLQALFGAMNDQAVNMVKKWDGSAGNYLNMSEEMMMLTQSIVTRSLFSTTVDIDAAALGSMLEQGRMYANEKMKNPFMLPLYIPTAKNRKYKEGLEGFDRLIYSIIQQRMEEGRDHGDLLGMLMAAKDEDTGEGMGLKQLRDEVATLFTAGQETTANALCFIFYLLARHPGAEDKMVREIGEVSGKGELCAEMLQKLTYTQMVIKEALRLYPPAWAVSRTAIEKDRIGGYDIRKGSTIFLSIYGMQRDPACWESADAFIPERFLPENFGPEQKKAYMPFGGGARICIGSNFAQMEMLAVLAAVYSRYRLVLFKDFDPVIKTPITMCFRNKLMMMTEKL